MAKEIELKLAVSSLDIERLRRRRILAQVERRDIRMQAIYFDTPDFLLRSRGLGLRLRQEGRQWLQTLKTGAPKASALSTRTEWESAARLVQGRPQIDLALLSGSPLPRLLARRGGVAALRPVFRARVVRTSWALDYMGARIEAALDVGALHARRAGEAMIEPVCEFELELKSGKPARLLELAGKLVGRGPDTIVLLPLARSKAERGYALALGEAAPVVKANAAGFRAALAPATRTTDALRAVVAHGIDIVVANAAAARRSYEMELIHQARVALRRMRSAARLLDRDQRDLPPRLVGELRWMTRAINGARDWDVLVESTLPAWIDSAAGRAAQSLRLLAQAVRHRALARKAAVAALSSARFARAVLDLQQWSMSKPATGRPLRKFAPRALSRAHARLFDAARFLSAQSPQRRHRVRILAKRLRYALDVLDKAQGSDKSVRYTEQLARLQDTLGEMNDAAVAATALARRAGRAAGRQLRRWADEQVNRLLPVAETLLAELQTVDTHSR